MIALNVEGMDSLAWGDLWPRHFVSGECAAWCGGAIMLCVVRPFTRDEDKVFAWLMEQDSCELYGIAHLSDGRDLIVLDRTFTKQSRKDAVAEHENHIRVVLESRGLMPLSFSH